MSHASSSQDLLDQQQLENSLVTRCPNCTTRFKVTAQQLKVASGRVRCGACLGVFTATETLFSDGVRVNARFSAKGDELIIDAHEPDPEIILGAPSTGIEQTAADVRTAAPSSEYIALEAMEKRLLEEMSSELEAPVSPSADTSAATDSTDTPAENTTAPVAAAWDVASERTIDVSVRVQTDDEDAASLAADTSIAQDGELDFEFESQEIQESVTTDQYLELDPAKTAGSSGVDTDSEHPASSSEQDESAQRSGRESFSTVQRATEHLQAKRKNTSSDDIDVVVDVGPAQPSSGQSMLDLELPQAPELPPVQHPIGTYAAIVLALLLIPVQLLWFQFEDWAKEPSIRPVYETICGLGICELPPAKDVTQIVSRRSVSRTDPDNPGQRVIDVLMVNSAAFAQPFPDIEVTFTDLDGQTVSATTFSADQYLRGEMTGVTLIQPRTPVHITLQVDDPGARVQGFRVEFR